jgi:ubiquinone/menaquinone biosynthesis C-methylase UbiE
MADLSRRIADLSPARRQLFERLLEAKTVRTGNGNEAASGPSTSAPSVSGRRFEVPNGPLTFDEGSSPAEAKAVYRRFYDDVSDRLNATEFGDFSFFLNYGYVPNHNPQYARVELPDHCLNKNSVKLALEVIGDCIVKARSVLDVGCGRGGTVSVLYRFFGPRMITGIDLSSAAVSFCRKAHRYAGVTFLEADAEALPFRQESFEIVTNVESSHSYPNIEHFYAEVFRVLTPGGYFLYTDILPSSCMNECGALLNDIGFLLEREQDITRNVLLSCDQTARARTRAFEQEGNSGMVEGFLGVPGSEVYEQMRRRQAIYKIFKLKKAEGDARW